MGALQTWFGRGELSTRDLVSTGGVRAVGVLFPVSMLAGLAESLGALFFARFLYELKDLGTASSAGTSVATVSFWAAGAIAVGTLGRGGGAWARSRLRESAARDSRSFFLRAFHEAPYAPNGKWETRFALKAGESAERKARHLNESLGLGAVGFGRLLGGSVILFALFGVKAATPVAVAVFFGAFGGWFQLRASRAYRALWRTQSQTRALVRESLEGWRTIRLLGRAPFVERRFQDRERELSGSIARAERELAAARAGNFAALISAIVLGIAVAAPMPWRQVVAFLLLLPVISIGSASLARVPKWWRRWRVAQKRRERGTTAQAAAARPPEVDWRRVKRLKIDHWFVRASDGLMMGPLTFEAAPGGISAIATSETRAFAAALCGLESTRGESEWRDADGTPVWKSGRYELGISPCDATALVEPNAPIYSASLRDNLTLGGVDRPSDVVLWECLRICSLVTFARQRGGLDGDPFASGPVTGGQRVLIALARALALKRPLLILENPYAVCSDSERALLSSAIWDCKDRLAVVLIAPELPDDLVFEKLLSFEEGSPSFLDVSAV